MKHTQIISFCLLIGSYVLLTPPLASENHFDQQTEVLRLDLNKVIYSKVVELIHHAQEVPGLTSEEFYLLREGIATTWDVLTDKGVLKVSGTDKETRPYFVALQAIVEHVLATELNKSVKILTGLIHTPMPATPLCSRGEISRELVDPTIELDPLRLFTVKVRTTIVRDYLIQGGNLYIIYPKAGLQKRTEEQQKIYLEEIANYPFNLFDMPLNCENIPTDIIGATYLFRDRSGKLFAFAIKMTQAKDPKDMGNFGLWFGSIEQAAIQERIREVSHFLEEQGSDVISKIINDADN